ncbi:hydrolase Nlp/P60 [Bacillus sp. HMF5848]|uniref:C40 family peptidase n=1 Tax=Bacillus sp. HMF5848 TaxID=2495421 RepID=UPI000F77FA06|nr:C40 family peptidase [Bacillus sp. HMF5848]RSK28677.1 hydrolase Nlp/P60 [Bacillus sp. HMF5848]
MIRRTSLILVSLFCIFFSITTESFAKDSYDNYNRLLPVAKKYIGVPYLYGGTSAKGFDCSGYINEVYTYIGVELPRTSRDMFNEGKAVKKENLRVGDLVFFNTSGNGVSHAGIYIGNDKFIHSSSSVGVSTSSLNDPYYWKSRYIGARRVLDLSEEANSFSDITDEHWAYEEITALAEDKLFIGFEEGQFLPNDNIARDEAAAYMAQALKLSLSDRSENYEDVSRYHWAVGAINALLEEDIIIEETEFRPAKALTRAELATWFVKAFNLKVSDNLITFTDIDTSLPYYNDVQALASSGITTGYDDGTFRPDEPVTRAQFAVFLYRALNQ